MWRGTPRPRTPENQREAPLREVFPPGPQWRLLLVLNGELDKQVLPQQNLPRIRKALQEGGNEHFEIDELPGLNHLFQTAKTGSLAEYAQIEETMSPIALDKMSSWILKQ